MATLVIESVSLFPFFGNKKNGGVVGNPLIHRTPWGAYSRLSQLVQNNLHFDISVLSNALAGTNLQSSVANNAATAAATAVNTYFSGGGIALTAATIITLYFPQPDGSHEIVLILIDDNNRPVNFQDFTLPASGAYAQEVYDVYLGLRINARRFGALAGVRTSGQKAKSARRAKGK